jgi:nucleotide-binding universal stress UspA family protein
MMYTTIVVGTDGSRQASDALVRAAEIAELAGLDEIHVVTAAHTYTAQEVQEIKGGLPAEFHEVVGPDLDATKRFQDARALLVGTGISIVEHPVDADPATGILDVAEQIGADLIVVGARGLRAAARFMRGSVSTRVAHHSHCDVLIVEHDHDDHG